MSEAWYRVVVGDPLVQADPFARVRERFRARYSDGTTARLVTRLESTGSLQCVAVAYLSPEAAELAHELHAKPLPRPSWLDPSQT